MRKTGLFVSYHFKFCEKVTNTFLTLYSKENFVCLVLHNEEMICEGVNDIDTLYDTPYMGFYANGYYDATNMNSMNYIFFTQK